HLARTVDLVLIVDDKSDDGTYEWLKDFERGSPVDMRATVRSDHVSSFAQDESEFRQWAWWWMSVVSGAEIDTDWILAIDADEFLVAHGAGILSSMPERSILERTLTSGGPTRS